MKLGFIGLGNMAKAILAGLLKSGMFSEQDIIGSDVAEAMRINVAEKYRIQTTASNAEVALVSDILILAVKPQFLEGVLAELADVIQDDTLVISIAAGKNLKWLRERLNTKVRVLRFMPNTAAMVGESSTAICRDGFATDEDVALAIKMCESFGVAQVIDEKLMDVFSAIGGSSPAFAFLYMEALADGAVAAGMPRKMAYEIAAQATLGAAKLMRESGEQPGTLKDMVCSPGGTTIQGIKALEEGGVRGSIMQAIDACVEKAKKL